jgi:hypothetical protein
MLPFTAQIVHFRRTSFAIVFLCFLHFMGIAQCCTNGRNLLAPYNPHFSMQGDPVPPGFENDNTYSPFLGPGLYSLVVSRNYGACFSSPQYDHTFGNESGSLLWFDTEGNASPETPAVAWMVFDPSRPPGQENTIDVQPNTEYVFSVWIRDLAREPDCVSGGAPVMGLRINGEDMAEINLADYTTPCCPDWVYLCATWNSGEATQALIQIESRSGIGWTDLGIDDVYFGTTFTNFENILGNDVSTCSFETEVLQPNVPGATYSWSDGSTADSFLVTAPGVYWVDILSAGCEGRDSIEFTLSEDAPSVTLGEDQTICEGETLNLFPETSTGVSYLWQNGSVGATLLASQAGTYWVQAMNDCGMARDSMELTTIGAPQLQLPMDTIVCEGTEVLLTLEATGAQQVFWQNGAGGTVVANQPGWYAAQATNACFVVNDSTWVRWKTDTLSLQWELEVDTLPCFEGWSIVGRALAEGYTSLEWWSDSQTVSTDTLFQTVLDASQGGRIELVIVGECLSEERLVADFEAHNELVEGYTIVVPTAFSPNNQGGNEAFEPRFFEGGREVLGDYSGRIFNRWGILVFDNRAGISWRGNDPSAGEVVDGVYFVEINYFDPCLGAMKSYSGALSLFR